jgi:Icc-related predicted phosphoesterase
MKLLLFSDLHCDVDAARRMVALASQADAVIGAGDFATMRKGLQQTLDVLRQIEQPTLLVAGNSESPEDLAFACQGWPSAHVLHGTACEAGGVSFFGLGGAVPPTPFGSWSVDLSEDEARQLLSGCPQHAVMITHSPPRGCVDRDSQGRSLGSVAVREAIERTQPLLVVCGHIHESAGQSGWIGASLVINAGPRGAMQHLNR